MFHSQLVPVPGKSKTLTMNPTCIFGLWSSLHLRPRLEGAPLQEANEFSLPSLLRFCRPSCGRGTAQAPRKFASFAFMTMSFCHVSSWGALELPRCPLAYLAVRRRSPKYLYQAEAKTVSGSGLMSRGAKGAKGSRNAAAVAAEGNGGGSPAPAVAKGTFSVQASADAKPGRRSSGFKMADAKALTRALAKGKRVFDVARRPAWCDR